MPPTLRTYWRAAASISSAVATGSSPRSVVMLRHMRGTLPLGRPPMTCQVMEPGPWRPSSSGGARDHPRHRRAAPRHRPPHAGAHDPRRGRSPRRARPGASPGPRRRGLPLGRRVGHRPAEDRCAHGARRLVLGVGAGFPGPDSRRELDVLGADYHRRVQALDAAVGTMRELWAAAARPGGSTDDVTILPPPVRPAGPAIWLAAGTPPGLDRCARTYDGWLPYPVTADDYAAGWQTIRGRANAAGRPPDAVEPALYVTVAVGEGSAPHDRLDAYCRAYYGAPSELVGTVQALASGARTRWRGACGATSRPAAATW
ncbi:LLM class flavin-dependent oxidoreductase [Actinomarinicola tropica]|uniref:LLM class flavin-dependent oxidoreductase n=1 Tax=Actinomarinicola tropica TaxID=2789776 RepID=A0A5Q2RPY6_9ACTN|nr:LLM class flavin-dependent oxidoreductase [Actinomarinicola tropica]QGG96187.1 LLM class flavin-dependent oxidoreductase [Actinomarinicola tropica]